MTGLEALKDIKSKPFSWEKLKDSLDIIEKELKAKDNLVSMCENLAKLVGLKEKDYVELETLITKKLTALDAIKRNPILIISLLTNNATYKYVVEVTNESERPTQEEWDLLKEVLK